eukprot:190700_1
MVRAGMKRSKLGEKKLTLLADRKKSVESRRNRDDKRWKRVLAKMSSDKLAEYKGVGNTVEGSRRRGATRASLRKREGRKSDTVTYEATIHMAKLLKKRTFNQRAPVAVKKIKKFAAKMMKTKDNRIDASLNTFIWSRGVKGVPGRIRIRLERKVAENPEGSSKRKMFYTVISNVAVPTFKKLTTTVVTK